jgi:hypothetical protein
MKANLFNPELSRFTTITRHDETVNLGAVGWIDTDLSGTVGTDTRKIWLIAVLVPANQVVGARPHGDANDVGVDCTNTVTILSRCDSAGHMDLARGAGNAVYKFIGYFS